MSQEAGTSGTPHPNLENVEDFSTVCRICATVTEFVIPIFEGEGLENNLADKIHKHLPIQVEAGDGLPRVVCYQCACTLLACHKLAQCAARADRALRARLPSLPAATEQVLKSQTEKEKQKEENVKPKVEMGLERDAAQPSPDAGLQPRTTERPTVVTDERGRKVVTFTKAFVKPLWPAKCTAPRRSPRAAPSPARGPAAPPRAPLPVGSITCTYCGFEQREDKYKDHLYEEHMDSLFQCQECDTYIDRKKLIVHMTLHYLQKVVMERKNNLSIKRETKDNITILAPRDRNENVQPAVLGERQVEIAAGRSVVKNEPANTGSVDETPQNEFSDQSDAEFGFEPLPESVFKAIADEDEGAATSGAPAAAPQAKGDKKTERHKRTRACAICGKTYSASSSYFYHMKHFHRQSREHSCESCARSFGTRAALAAHATVHSGERALACPRCPKAFGTRAALYIHSQTHGGAAAGGRRRLACAACGRSFRWRAALRRHEARHAGERAHACPTCGRAFSVRSDLARHARTHAARAVSCADCGANFAQPRYLAVHRRRKHAATTASTASGAA